MRLQALLALSLVPITLALLLLLLLPLLLLHEEPKLLLLLPHLLQALKLELQLLLLIMRLDWVVRLSLRLRLCQPLLVRQHLQSGLMAHLLLALQCLSVCIENTSFYKQNPSFLLHKIHRVVLMEIITACCCW